MNSVSIVWGRAMMAGWDMVSWLLAFVLLVVIRYNLSLTEAQWLAALQYSVAAVALTVGAALGFHLYLGRSRVGSFAEANSLGILVAAVSLVLGVVFLAFVPHFPRGVALVLPPLALMFMGSGRWAYRSLLGQGLRRLAKAMETPRPKAVVYGAGEDGHDVARLVDHAKEPPYAIVGFLDDDLATKHRRIGSYRVLGRGTDLLRVAEAQGVEVVILAISDASRDLMDRVAEECRTAGMKFVTVPPVRERISGRVRLQELREFNVADLLGRRQIETDLEEVAGYVTDRVVLVTGAGGSIGSELSRQVHALRPRKLVLLDRDESALHALQLSIYGSGLLDTEDMVLCDIRDAVALHEVFRQHRPEVVFHAAALKHLPMLERFPLEGWKSNVAGTLNVLEAAQAVGVGTLVNISTDKAADPTNVLGQTKRMAERLTSWYAGQFGLRYLSVRFGNVLGSRGSVLYTFRAQIERGGPITVTDPEVTRYFMTIPEACELVLQAGAIGLPGDVMVLDMGDPIRIIEVARRLLEESHRTDIGIEFTGLRPGEKLNEVLFSARESGEPSTHPLISRVAVPALAPGEVRRIDPQDLSLVSSVLGDQREHPAGLLTTSVQATAVQAERSEVA